MIADNPSLDVIRRRLLWRACHRGIKEMDLIVGGFAKAYLVGMDAGDLEEFARILELPDHDLLSWTTGQSAVTPALQSPLLSQMLAFRPDFLS